ncbi:hypothetical protein C8Q79DRAFT_1011791 [Trametes meyenii]|nr:hypothetical protein C8Q79DRAFT_1011791 [Trametes meyenii]
MSESSSSNHYNNGLARAAYTSTPETKTGTLPLTDSTTQQSKSIKLSISQSSESLSDIEVRVDISRSTPRPHVETRPPSHVHGESAPEADSTRRLPPPPVQSLHAAAPAPRLLADGTTRKRPYEELPRSESPAAYRRIRRQRLRQDDGIASDGSMTEPEKDDGPEWWVEYHSYELARWSRKQRLAALSQSEDLCPGTTSSQVVRN